MKHHITFTLLALLLWTGIASAQVAEAWLTMPDSLCPYLTQQQRYQLVQLAKSGVRDTIKNNLDGKTVVDSINLSTDYLSVRMTAQSVWTLTCAAGIIRLDQTVCAPKCNTISDFYDFAWNLLRREKEPFIVEETEEEKQQEF